MTPDALAAEVRVVAERAEWVDTAIATFCVNAGKGHIPKDLGAELLLTKGPALQQRVLSALRHIESLGAEVESQAAELERLRAIVDRLPKTKDGVPVVAGEDMVWDEWPAPGQWDEFDVLPWIPSHHEDECHYVSYERVPHCYSTRAAAEAAKEACDEPK